MDEPPLSALEEKLAEWIGEALELRHSGEDPPSIGSDPQDVLDSLLRVRKRLDRVEGILAAVERAKGRVARSLAVANFSSQVAWDEALKNVRQREYQGSKERYAEANLASLVERRNAHQMEVLFESARTAAVVVRDAHRGLNGVREDHLAILRAMNIGTRLET
jgi:hypothetical protein